MKRGVLKALFLLSFVFCAMFAFSISSSAATYEPDGMTSNQYEYASNECNRTIVISCVDESGRLLKKINVNTKYGSDDICYVSIYNYNPIAFSSDQGLWETCKLMWTSGGMQCEGDIDIDYYFRTALSKKTINVTVTMRAFDQITIKENHYKEQRSGADASLRNYILSDTKSTTLYCGSYFSTKAKNYTGYTLKDGYFSSLNGYWSMSMFGTPQNMGSLLNSMEWDIINSTWKMDGKDYPTWTEFDESRDGSLGRIENRVISIEYKYNVNWCTFTFHANGGSGAPSEKIEWWYNHNITIPSTVPTRTGYTFQGWGTSSTDTTPDYQPGQATTMGTTKTLYAIWKANTYTVSYNANGGTGAPSSQTKTHNVTLTLRTTTPTRSGYSFLGWSTSSTATSPTYYAGGSYTANASATLYAVWSYNAPTVYTISFNANGGSGAPSSVTKTHGVTLYLPSNEPTRTNYDFLGWSTSSTATTPTYYAGGSFTQNANTTLYAVWEYDPAIYLVNYNANGGIGAPSSQTKTYGVSLTLSSVIPTRSGYDFLGWSTSSTATSATYDPGDSYTTNASVTLYAVWQETNYDFSISNLTVSNSEPYKYDQITVKVRTDSWDQVNAYSDIPVQLYYDGRLVSTQYVNFSVYGVANITFTLNVGSSVGNKTIEARINWADHNSETRTGNNTVSTSINVQDYDYEVTADPISMAGYYCEGMEVISSFYVANNSDYDIIPSMHNTARFTAYYYNVSQKVVISTQDWDDVVIPAAGTNLVYFKWTVPAGLSGKKVYLECTVNADRYMNETNYDNNTATFSTTVSNVTASQTPNTRFESEAPNSYQSASTPSINTDKATWTMWEYENGIFVLKKYGVQISSVSPVVAPSTDCVTAVYENGKWTMRSGYGITMSYAPTISTVSGYNLSDSSAYTSVQYVVATFPEFRYFDTDGNCRTLQYVNGSYQFVENPDADGNARVHFIPLYMKDGNYTISVTATHVWTPAGMIEATRSANVIIIDGTIYDDWYQG